MRVRLESAHGREQLAKAIERLGGSALTIGDTLELVHPDRIAAQDSRIELAFFVRAWASTQVEHTPEIIG